MKRQSARKRSEKELKPFCGQPGPDDGVHPRDFFKPARNRRTNRKDWQLCRQVSETLNYVMSGECHDEVLRNLVVSKVEPAPNAQRLIVTVCPCVPDKEFNPILALERLQQAVGRLRSEVARSISRRKVPELMFRVVIDDSLNPSAEETSHDQ